MNRLFQFLAFASLLIDAVILASIVTALVAP